MINIQRVKEFLIKLNVIFGCSDLKSVQLNNYIQRARLSSSIVHANNEILERSGIYSKFHIWRTLAYLWWKYNLIMNNLIVPTYSSFREWEKVWISIRNFSSRMPWNTFTIKTSFVCIVLNNLTSKSTWIRRPDTLLDVLSPTRAERRLSRASVSSRFCQFLSSHLMNSLLTFASLALEERYCFTTYNHCRRSLGKYVNKSRTTFRFCICGETFYSEVSMLIHSPGTWLPNWSPTLMEGEDFTVNKVCKSVPL